MRVIWLDGMLGNGLPADFPSRSIHMVWRAEAQRRQPGQRTSEFNGLLGISELVCAIPWILGNKHRNRIIVSPFGQDFTRANVSAIIGNILGVNHSAGEGIYRGKPFATDRRRRVCN